MDSRVNDEAAFILHRRDYQNNSLILELFTQHYGRVSAVVKGAKKRKDISSFQIGNRLSLGWSGHSELKTITQAECRNISIPVKSFYALFYVNELMLNFFAKGDEYDTFFEAYQVFILELSHLESEPQDFYRRHLEILLRNLELDMLSELGYLPSLTTDHSTGEHTHPDHYYRMEQQSGLTRCHQQPRGPDCILGQEYLAIQQRDFSTESSLRCAKFLLRRIIDFHLQGRALQSRTLYQKLFNNQSRETR